MTGSTIAHYEILEKLGEGGMGVVWRAIDTTLDREVAIKVLPPGLATDPERLARFEREAKLLASLHYPNIASVFGLHEAGGSCFLAMELVPGEDLSQRLARGPIPVDEALPVARQIATALETAHAFAGAREWAKENPGKRILIGNSGRGDKDMPTLTKFPAKVRTNAGA